MVEKEFLPFAQGRKSVPSIPKSIFERNMSLVIWYWVATKYTGSIGGAKF
jgi:hypothetical protein